MNLMRGSSPQGDQRMNEIAVDRARSAGTPTPGSIPGTPTPVSVMPGGGAFDTFPDYSRINSCRHNASRADTFGTPARLQPQPGKNGRASSFSNVGTKEILEVCELSFAKNLRVMQHTLLKDLKDEINSALGPLRLELSGTVADARGATAMEAVLKAIRQIEVPAVDMTPIYGQLQGLQQANEEATQLLGARFSEEVGSLQGQLQNTWREQAQADGLQSQRLGDIEGAVRRLEEQFASSLETQQALCARSAQLAEGMRQMQLDRVEQQAGFVSTIAGQLTKHVKEQPVNVDLGPVIGSIGKCHQLVGQDFSILLSEIAKVQKALNVDFGHWINHQADDAAMTQSNGRVNALDLNVVPEALVAAAGRASIAVQPTDRGRLSGSRISGGSSTALSRPRRFSVRGSTYAAHSALSMRVLKRMRDMGCQTENAEQADACAQTDGFWQASQDKRNQRRRSTASKAKPAILQRKPVAQKNMFADAERMKQRARDALIRPQYNVFNEYHYEGVVQALAKSVGFESLTFVVIVLNSMWMAVDTDHNQSPILIQAEPLFIVVENIFCLYFFGELLIRFLAFRRKKRCLGDSWFMFDLLLLILMATETWIISIIAWWQGLENGAPFLDDVSILRIVRILRMLRISRVARIVRAVPELVILLKGVFAASRSVSVFFLLWAVIIYMYSLILRQIADSTGTTDLFSSVPHTMNKLLLDGILPNYSGYVSSLAERHPIYWPLMLSFIGLAVMTLMNMLVGVLVEVVGAIAGTEKEGMRVMSLASALREAMVHLGLDLDRPFTKEEFQNLLVHSDIAQIVTSAGVDVVLLVEMTEAIFDDFDQSGVEGLRFEGFVELVLNMRGTNPAKVKDIKEQLRLIKTAVSGATRTITARMDEEFVNVQRAIQEIRDLVEESDMQPPAMSASMTDFALPRWAATSTT